MATTRQKRARRVAAVQGMRKEHREKLDERLEARKQAAQLPDKAKPLAEFSTLTGQTLRTSLSAVTLATAMSQRPETLLELPIVDKRGKVSASWFRAGAIISVVDLSGMREFPRN